MAEITYAPMKDGGKHPFPVADVRLDLSKCLRGNVLIKADNVKLDLEAKHIKEILRCKADPVYFFAKYCRINALGKGYIPFKVFDYQKDVIEAFRDNKFICVCMGRQQGKCVTHNTFINIKNNRTKEEYYLPIGEYHQFIKDKTYDISKFKLSRQNHIDLSALGISNK